MVDVYFSRSIPMGTATAFLQASLGKTINPIDPGPITSNSDPLISQVFEVEGDPETLVQTLQTQAAEYKLDVISSRPIEEITSIHVLPALES